MQKSRPILAWETLLDLDADTPGARSSLRDRVERALRRAIDEGRLEPGSALPPSRALAETLGVSRWVVTEAYGQLVAEGVLDARTGSATRVSLGPGTALPRPPAPGPSPSSDAAPPIRYDLRPGIPDLRATPRSRWAAALRNALASLPDHDLAAAHPRGYAPARDAVAAYLSRSRRADPDAARVTITHGATDGMDLLTRELHRRGHRTILVEDPSWPRLRAVAESNGLRPVPVPVDEDGVDTDVLAALSAQTGARAALVTPAHQFPFGAALSPGRREQVIRWARAHRALIIEDDYDAEFRYDRRPIPALQRLAPDHVALIGSLSKSVSPALGLGWMLLPTTISPPISASPPSLVDQAALAHFLTRGDFERHLRTARSRFRHRRARLLDAIRRDLPGLDVTGIAAGMHLVLALPTGTRAAALTSGGAELGLGLTALQRYVTATPRRESLVLGYGNLDDALIEEAVARLALLIRNAAE
ncbi:MocR-like pyridoxine biosynthesis transcription factor PdxR [Zhihengliuella sp. ISTPL4]|uniref:MocR-like pyridoxine biosynthesis transcription factor PdxR n=1 Tax=Zhihengliuella sp. ISTPL4 TaxID=2058657 RepID=UPI002570028A|nr:PLP-dependent aminotransferase family protein [Zhihengliuella sp. ISTPL4]